MIPPSSDGVEKPAPPDPLRGWSKIQRLAAFLIMLGREGAATIMREFDHGEIAEIVTEMARIDFVSQEQQDALLKEFAAVAHMATTSPRGGLELAREVMEITLGQAKASEIINRIAPKKAHQVDGALLRKLELDALLRALNSESLQTKALVFTYLEPKDCAELLTRLQPNERTEIVVRMGLMEPISSEVVERILQEVKARCEMKTPINMTRSGGARNLAEVLHAMDDPTLRQTLADLQARNPELGAKVKKMLFVFEDLGDLDARTILEITKTVEMVELALALKTASEKVRKAIYAALPKRRVEYLQDQIDSMPTVRLAEVQRAQNHIVDIAQKLQADGLIHLAAARMV